MQLTKFTGLARLLPSPLYKIAAQSFVDYEFPRHIFIETTANCNLTCAYCPREKRQENMDYELFKEIVNEASHYGPRSFSMHLFGEPLLYPKIMEGINYIKTKNKRHTILLTTNGTVLNKFSKRLLESGVNRIIWSWRSLPAPFSSETLEVLKRIGMVRILIEETPKEEFEKWSKFPRVEVKHLHNYGGQIDTTKWGLEKDLDDSVTGNRYPCYHLWLAPAVRWNGQITICCNDPNGRESWGVYNSTSSNIHNFWTSNHLRSIREFHLKGEYKGLCVGCNSYKAYPNIFFKSQCSPN